MVPDVSEFLNTFSLAPNSISAGDEAITIPETSGTTCDSDVSEVLNSFFSVNKYLS
jgi:hypothetical protein